VPDFIRPNYHALLVDLPVGLLVMGTVIELLSFMYRRHPVRDAGRWMILIGALWTVPAATSGIYAMWDVATHRDGSLDTWSATLQAKLLDPDQWTLLSAHLLWTSLGMGMCLASALWWLGSSDRWRRRLYFPLLFVLVMGLLIGDRGMHHAGNAVFVHHMAIEPTTNPADTIHPALGSSTIEQYVNTMQVHVIFGGFVFSGALLAIGLSIRRMVRGNELLAEQLPEAPPDAPAVGEAVADRNQLMVAAIRSSPEMSIPPLPKIPAARFALVAVGLAVLTILVGLYVAGITDWTTFQADFLRAHSAMGDQNRDIVHAILAAGTLVFLLILAAVARFAPRSGIAIGIFSFLLFLVIAAQFWMGTLILLDSSKGPLMGFNPAEGPAAAVAHAATTAPATTP